MAHIMLVEHSRNCFSLCSCNPLYPVLICQGSAIMWRSGLTRSRTTLHHVSRSFLEQVHTKGLNQLHQLLEGEQWVAVDVPPSVQVIADRLMAKCVSAASSWAGGEANSPGTTSPMKLPSSASAPYHPSSTHAARPGGPTALPASVSVPATPPNGMASGQLQLLGRRFPVVTSGLILLKLLDQYLELQVREACAAGKCRSVCVAHSAPMYAQETVQLFGAEVAHRAVELLKVFNSKVCRTRCQDACSSVEN